MPWGPDCVQDAVHTFGKGKAELLLEDDVDYERAFGQSDRKMDPRTRLPFVDLDPPGPLGVTPLPLGLGRSLVPLRLVLMYGTAWLFGGRAACFVQCVKGSVRYFSWGGVPRSLLPPVCF